ncbi:MAG: restriction endonuclease [Bacteroidetes bacterium]|nr:restriction endonuclease [Bacteroidota bacterium]
MPQNIIITKASGEQVPFSTEKLKRSLERSGAGEAIINNIIAEVEKNLFEGISTKKIYHKAFALLRKTSKPIAAKYKLKQAIMELGPSGYPFEKYIGEILKQQGFSVKVGEVLKGHCVNHEIDVIAEKGNNHYLIECKYHNTTGIICDVKIPLYIQARFKDVEQHLATIPGNGSKFNQRWVVTNTRFSTDAIQYGLCVGLNLIGWDFPKKGSLREQIDNSMLYPVTCLSTLTKTEKQRLLDNKIVLSKELSNNSKLLMSINIRPNRFDGIFKEINSLCSTKK